MNSKPISLITPRAVINRLLNEKLSQEFSQIIPHFPNLEMLRDHPEVILTIFVCGTIRMLSKYSREGLDYRNTVNSFQSNPLAVELKEKAKFSSKKFNIENYELESTWCDYFTFFEQQTGSDVIEFCGFDGENWKSLINNIKQIIQDVKLLPALDYKFEKELINLSVLVYPNSQRIYFEMYKLKIIVYIQRFADSDKRDIPGIMLDFESKSFEPNIDVIEKMKPEIKLQAAKEFRVHFENLNLNAD
jgi:hypothetical protein